MSTSRWLSALMVGCTWVGGCSGPADAPDPAAEPDPTEEQPEPPPVETGDSGTVPELPEVDCTDACRSTDGDAGRAVCYSCRCKAAMDGWLPSTDQLQCANGAEIVVYTTDARGDLSVVDTDVSTCANPSLLYGTCAPGGTLGQLTHGDVTAKWICRRNVFHADAAAQPALPYDDVGLILYNARNGASCWFDDMDGTGIAADNWPEMDLSGPDGDVSAYLGFFYDTDGRGCTGCHDNDPFNDSPYLQSVGWVTGPYTSGGFSRVAVDGGLDPVDSVHLVSPEVAACTACHRIASDATCSDWAPDSLGLARNAGAQPLLIDAIGDPTSPLWPLLAWMPYGDALDPDAWEATYGLARDTIRNCCSRPGVATPECQWAPNF